MAIKWKEYSKFAGELKKFIKELLFYFLGASMEATKEKDWKGYLFLWPAILAIVIVLYYVVSLFL